MRRFDFADGKIHPTISPTPIDWLFASIKFVAIESLPITIIISWMIGTVPGLVYTIVAILAVSRKRW